MRKTLAAVGVGLLAMSLVVVGCTTERRTVRTETETVIPQTPPRIIEEQHTTIERTPGSPDDEERTIIRKRHSTESIESETEE